MANDVLLQDRHPVDENLRPLTIGGKVTSIELSQQGSGARVNGDLKVTGSIIGIDTRDITIDDLVCDTITTAGTITSGGVLTADAGINVDNITIDGQEIDLSTGDLTLDVAGDIILNADAGEIYFKDDTVTLFLVDTNGGNYYSSGVRTINLTPGTSAIRLFSILDTDDYCTITGLQHGAFNLTTHDDVGNEADISITADGFVKLSTGSTGEDITLDSSGSVIIDCADDEYIRFKENNLVMAEIFEDSSKCQFKIRESPNGADNCILSVGAAGVTTLVTTDLGGADAHLTLEADGKVDVNSASGENITLDSGGGIILDSDGGNFMAKKAGTEFSVANSMYAGMILGYTSEGINQTPATYTLTTSNNTVASGTHHVSFIAPPSGAVEIEVLINYDTGSGSIILKLGLTDNTNMLLNSLPAYLAHQIVEAARGVNDFNVVHKWTVTGLTAGDTYKWYLTAYVNSTIGTPKLQWGGDSISENPPFIMKATALPTAVADFAIYG